MTIPAQGWHVGDAALRGYADGSASAIAGASVEAHLMGCATCRQRLGALIPREPLEKAWEAVRTAMETPRVSVVERLLGWLGVPTESARLLAAVPAFRGAWLLGLLTITAFAGAAAAMSEIYGVALFLLVAPLAPVAGVAASFGGDADPSHELVTVTPHPAARLLLLRTGGVLATSLPIAVLVGLVLPGSAWLAVAWLMPAVAGVTLSLALTPMIGCTAASAAVAGTWAVVVGSGIRMRDPLEVVEPVMQLGFIAITSVALVVLIMRSASFEQIGRES
jgi:hypothetical protein